MKPSLTDPPLAPAPPSTSTPAAFATRTSTPTPALGLGPSPWAGWGSGLLGVLIFSGSLPATRLAVAGFPPLFLTAARASLAALLGALLLLLLRQRRPRRDDAAALAVVAGGVVVGFPLLTALALQQMTSARSIIYIGLLPLATALFAVLRGAERPRPAFWLFAAIGSAAVAAFALRPAGIDTGEMPATAVGDALMVAAVIVCGLGYAEGAVLSRRLGGWQVISWALLLSLPMMAVLAWFTRPASFDGIAPSAWWGLGYVSLFSMLIGFVFWYRGLARGGIARVGQLQLLQPLLCLVLASVVVGETVAPMMLATASVVVICVALAKRYG